MSIWSDMEDRSAGDIVRKEDANWGRLRFGVDESVKLLDSEIVMIIDAALKSFTFGGFSKLDKMLSTLGVTLVISPDTPKRIVPSGISEWVLYWENELQRLEKVLGPDDKNNQFYKDALEEHEKAKKEVDAWSAMALLGRYDRFQKKIILYPNNMPGQDRKGYLVTTFVHEAMHAYFDRHPRELFPYVATVEEPLAEFGMLLFLKETNNNYYKWAYDNVVSKETCYRYGAALMDRYEKGDNQIRQDLESYKRKVF
ncbi:MAG: hypothetical protein PUC72_09260 [Bacteroidales bacterium]|nr:hypothetical protein [Bacteroidales bacterium]